MASNTLCIILFVSFIISVTPGQAQLPFPLPPLPFLPPFPFPFPPIGPNPKQPGVSSQCINAVTNLGTCLPEIFRAVTTRSPLSVGCCQKIDIVNTSCLPAGAPKVNPFFSFLCKATPPTPMPPAAPAPWTVDVEIDDDLFN